MKRYHFWTGPVGVDQFADKLKKKGCCGVFSGTEDVYFMLPKNHDAQRYIDRVYPRVGFKVHPCY